MTEPLTVNGRWTPTLTTTPHAAERRRRTCWTVNAHILPALGDKLVAHLNCAALRSWHQKLAASPARQRTKAKATTPNVRQADTACDKRARRATANRVLATLKAALSLAYREGRVQSDDAWRRVTPFSKVDAARVRYLTDPEAVRLVNACPADLRKLVTAALLTGSRYAELAALRAGDFDAQAAVLHIRQAKAGRPRAVPLTDDAVRFFAAETAGKARVALVLAREDGRAWGKSHQFRRCGMPVSQPRSRPPSASTSCATLLPRGWQCGTCRWRWWRRR